MIYVEKISISPHTKILNVGDRYRDASAVVCPSNATCKSIRWYSDDSCIAYVAATTGFIAAVKPGKTKIYAEATDGSGVRNYISITVIQPVTSISLDCSSATINIGETKTLTAIVSPSNASNKNISWTSSNESVATVNSNGIVTGIGAGSTTIIASTCDGSGIVAYCTVNIKQPVTGITLNHSSIVINVSQTKSLTASVSPTNASNKSISWNSNDNTIATVSNNGVVTGVSAGTTTITASAKDGSGIVEYCAVEVIPSIKENVEYHIIPYSNINSANKKALEINMQTKNDTDTNGSQILNKMLPLEYDESLQLSAFSYVNKQRWVLKKNGEFYKVYTKHGQAFILCKKNNDSKVYVSNNTSLESNISIIPYGSSANTFEIKLNQGNLYLTVSENNIIWSTYSSSNHMNQIWAFEEKPANIHNGVDTTAILDESTISSLKSNNVEFVIRYYKILDTLEGVELLTLSSENYNGENIPKIEATILKLKNKGIDIDAENYLEYADTLLISDSNLYITGNGKSLVSDEKKRYLNHNINIITVYQNAGNKYEYFTEKHAKLDALSALLSAKILGQPHNTTIYFAVDYNAKNSELERIANYFATIKNKFNGRYKIGVYGSGTVCNYIKDELGLADYSWLSQATGHAGYPEYDKISKYNIKQLEEMYYQNTKFDCDISVDNDYGQW